MRRAYRLFSLLGLLTCTWPNAVDAKPYDVSALYPGGAQRGTTAEVMAVGDDDLAWPIRAWSSHSGLQVELLEEKPRLQVHVSADTPRGVHWLRFYTEDGASSLRPFLVGTLNEALEVEPNNEPRQAQALGESVTVNGRLSEHGDVDVFAVQLQKGQTLVAAVQGHRHLLSPLDAILQLVSPQGFVLQQNDDDQERDPRIVFTVPTTGKYLVRVFGLPLQPNQRIRFSGEKTYVYRLTLTTGAFIDHVYPLALPRYEPGAVELHGWNIPAELKKFPLLAASERERVLVQHAAIGNSFPLRLVSRPVLLENPAADGTNTFEFPASFTGRINPPGDRDVYEFHAKKGDKRRFSVEARTLGSLIDPAVRILTRAGEAVVQLDDPREDRKFDPYVDFTAPEDGDYKLEVRDVFEHGGERYVYCVHAVIPRPHCSLTVTTDRYTLTSGTELEIPVKIDRRDGFASDVEITLLGLPANVTTTSVRSTSKENTNECKLKLNAEPGLFSGSVRIVAQDIGPKARLRTATFQPGGWHPPNDLLWLTVINAPEKEASK